MTAVALRAELAQVAIVLAVARAALLRHSYRARRFTMALDALQLGVSAEQREVRVLGVIESPQRPAVRRVTAFAFLSEPAFVDVIMRMALDARRADRAERQRRVALGTTDDSVQP